MAHGVWVPNRLGAASETLTVAAGTRKAEAEGGFEIVLENKFGITDPVELARLEEKTSKAKALALFDEGLLAHIPVGIFAGLAQIHKHLFSQIYDFAGKVRTVNIAKGGFRFAPAIYLNETLVTIDAMPQKTFDEIVEKYVEMNIAHPFREGNGRSTRIWLDMLLKKELLRVVDWSAVDQDDYLPAMARSPVNDAEIKALLKAALTENIHDRDVFLRGIDASYCYEGYHAFKAEHCKAPLF